MHLLALLCWWLWQPQGAFAQIFDEASIPTYHWASEYLAELQLRQPALKLWTATLPLRADRVAQTLQSFAGDERAYAAQLRSYFSTRTGTLSEPPQFFFGGLSSGGFGQIEDEMRSRLSQRFATGVRFSEHLFVHNVVNIDEALLDDPTYSGKKWRGFAAITEQAYGVLHGSHYQLKVGRDFVRWGRGQDATLLISDNALPFDQVHLQLQSRFAQFSYFAAQLDRFTARDSLGKAIPNVHLNRYLSAVRIDFSLLNNRLQISVGQAALYGRTGGFDWNYLNPFLVFHGEVLNSGSTANSFGSLDFSFFPRAGIELYGEVLIDDFQIEKSSVVDLEPDEYGWLLGTRLADVFGARGLTTGLEYTKVKNRTYNSPEYYEKFLHRNRAIGHFLGNDFDRWLLFTRKYLGRSWRVHAQADFRRHGQGRIAAPWDTPWLASTLEEGYSEPFPTGIVEKTSQLGLEVRWHPKPHWFVELSGKYSKFSNHLNVPDADYSETEIRLNIWLEWSTWMKI